MFWSELVTFYGFLCRVRWPLDKTWKSFALFWFLACCSVGPGGLVLGLGALPHGASFLYCFLSAPITSLMSLTQRIQIPKILVKCWQECGEIQTWTHCRGSINWFSHFEGNLAASIKMQKCLPCDSAITLLYIFSRETYARMQWFTLHLITIVKS